MISPCSFSASLNQQAARTLAWPLPRLAAQHQDDEDDNHNENNGSDTDIHEGDSSLGCRSPVQTA
jgi:hypothetical protein